jgi:hypothetical protein
MCRCLFSEFYILKICLDKDIDIVMAMTKNYVKAGAKQNYAKSKISQLCYLIPRHSKSQ